MTDPTHDEIEKSSVHSDKSPHSLAETIRVGMQVAAQMNREELLRQFRCVQLYGYGYLLNHGGKQIALDPKDVTVVLPSTRHMDDFDLHNSLHLTERKLAAAYKRIDELEDAAVDAVFSDVFAERDEARRQVQVLQERIAKVREMAEKIECGNCDHPAKLHAPICTHEFRGLQCMCDWKGLGHEILAVLDGEGEEAVEP